MPELPEVETVRMQLEKFLSGHKIEGIEIRADKIFQGEAQKLVGGEIINLRRFGKALIIDLDNNASLMIHLKMTGQLIYRGPNLKKNPTLSKNVGTLPSKHTHVIIRLDKNGKLYFNDLRKFGYIKVLKTSEVEKQSFIDNLGPEPLKDLDLKYLKAKLAKSSQAIKLFLLDQKKISGIGNIYANDALFLARIDPRKPVNKITDTEAKKLLQSIEEVMRRGLKYSGASDNSYVTATGADGVYQEYFLVYGKKGEDCPNDCGGKIERITQGGRGTFFCPICQN